MRKRTKNAVALLAACLMTAGAFGCSKGGNISSMPDQITLGSLSVFTVSSSESSSVPSALSVQSSLPASSAAVSSPASSTVESVEPHEVTLDEFIDTFIGIAEEQPQYPVKDGKTIYGELFGNPYAEWCTEFVMYCLKQADDELGTAFIGTIYPWRDCAYDTGVWFKYKNRYFDAHGDFIPSRGDLIIFDSDYKGVPNHIGIVTGTVVENGITYITTIEGNIPEDEVKQVRCRKLAVTDPIIMAYCSTTVTSEYTGPLDEY